MSLLLLVPARAQKPAEKNAQPQSQARVTEQEVAPVSEAESAEAQRCAFAISLVTSLADDARSYHDLALRPHVLARAADRLWDADKETARVLFRRAWEAGEKGDAEGLAFKSAVGAPAMAVALLRSSGHDLRADVLALAARRDRVLGEEFLSKLREETKRETTDSKNSSASDSWSDSEEASKRIQLARKLLELGEVDRALQFAAPVLTRVSANSIGFLSALHAGHPELADQKFAFLLTRAEFDPSSDANTASGLSSYVFTPGLYVTFNSEGGARWSQPDEATTSHTPPSLPPPLFDKFFQVAASILLRPSPPPDRDFTSCGRTGKYMVIKRLLPLFDQYAPDSGSALRTQLAALVGDRSPKALGDDNNPLLRQGLAPDETAAEARLIDPDDPDRTRALIGVATQFVTTDRVRAWEIMGEAIKAANASEKFTGENVQLNFSLMSMRNGLKISSVAADDFGLDGVSRSLAKDDLYRSIDLAKSFRNDAPRANAILIIAGAVLEKAAE